MGMFDKAKDAAAATGEKVSEEAEEMKDRIADQIDAMKADAKAKEAEAEREATHLKNDYKERLRED